MPIQKKPVQWKTAMDVRRISGIHFDKEPIARGGSSRVFLARLHFKDRKRHRVAIKLNRTIISDAEANARQIAIEKLRAADVRIPKMAMLKLPTPRCPQGEWVQVSEFFGSSTKGSKLTRIDAKYHKTLEQKKEAIIELAKIALAGYLPHFDAVEFLNNKKSVVLVDLDLVYSYSHEFTSMPSPSEIARDFYISIGEFAQNGGEKKALATFALSKIKENRKLYDAVKKYFD